MSNRAIIGAGPDSDERRTQARFHFQLEASCRTIASGSKEGQPAQVCDVSARGLGLVLTRRFEPGSLLSLEITDSPKSIASTLLLRVVNVRNLQEGGWLHGCSFVSHLSGNDMQAAFRVKLNRPPGRERRALLRYDFQMQVSGRSIAAAQKVAWTGMTQDLSAGGIALALAAPIEAGTLLTLKLQSSQQSVTRTLITRVLHARAQSAGGFLHGCAFPSKLREEELQALLQLGWSEQQMRRPRAEGAHIEKLKLALADQIERNVLPEASATIEAILKLDANDADALAVRVFLDSATCPAEPIGQVRLLEGHRSSVNTVAFFLSGHYALSGSGIDDALQKDEDRTVRFWDVAAGYEINCFHGHKAPIVSLSLPERGSRALSASRDGAMLLWDVDRRCVIRQFDHPRVGLTCVAYSPHGRWVLSTGDDMTLRLWDGDLGRSLRSFKGTAPITSAAFLTDDRSAVTGDMDGAVRVWNLESEHRNFSLAGHTKPVLCVARSPDGKCVLSGSVDNTIRLWDVGARKEIRRFDGHENVVNSVAISPTGQWVLSGSADNTVRLWDVATGRQLLCFTGHSQSVKCVAFSPDGRVALSASADASIRVWALPGSGEKDE